MAENNIMYHRRISADHPSHLVAPAYHAGLRPIYTFALPAYLRTEPRRLLLLLLAHAPLHSMQLLLLLLLRLCTICLRSPNMPLPEFATTYTGLAMIIALCSVRAGSLLTQDFRERVYDCWLCHNR